MVYLELLAYGCYKAKQKENLEKVSVDPPLPLHDSSKTGHWTNPKHLPLSRLSTHLHTVQPVGRDLTPYTGFVDQRIQHIGTQNLIEVKCQNSVPSPENEGSHNLPKHPHPLVNEKETKLSPKKPNEEKEKEVELYSDSDHAATETATDEPVAVFERSNFAAKAKEGAKTSKIVISNINSENIDSTREKEKDDEMKSRFTNSFTEQNVCSNELIMDNIKLPPEKSISEWKEISKEKSSENSLKPASTTQDIAGMNKTRFSGLRINIPAFKRNYAQAPKLVQKEIELIDIADDEEDINTKKIKLTNSNELNSKTESESDKEQTKEKAVEELSEEADLMNIPTPPEPDRRDRMREDEADADQKTLEGVGYFLKRENEKKKREEAQSSNVNPTRDPVAEQSLLYQDQSYGQDPDSYQQHSNPWGGGADRRNWFDGVNNQGIDKYSMGANQPASHGFQGYRGQDGFAGWHEDTPMDNLSEQWYSEPGRDYCYRGQGERRPFRGRRGGRQGDQGFRPQHKGARGYGESGGYWGDYGRPPRRR